MPNTSGPNFASYSHISAKAPNLPLRVKHGSDDKITLQRLPTTFWGRFSHMINAYCVPRWLMPATSKEYREAIKSFRSASFQKYAHPTNSGNTVKKQGYALTVGDINDGQSIMSVLDSNIKKSRFITGGIINKVEKDASAMICKKYIANNALKEDVCNTAIEEILGIEEGATTEEQKEMGDTLFKEQARKDDIFKEYVKDMNALTEKISYQDIAGVGYHRLALNVMKLNILKHLVATQPQEQYRELRANVQLLEIYTGKENIALTEAIRRTELLPKEQKGIFSNIKISRGLENKTVFTQQYIDTLHKKPFPPSQQTHLSILKQDTREVVQKPHEPEPQEVLLQKPHREEDTSEVSLAKEEASMAQKSHEPKPQEALLQEAPKEEDTPKASLAKEGASKAQKPHEPEPQEVLLQEAPKEDTPKLSLEKEDSKAQKPHEPEPQEVLLQEAPKEDTSEVSLVKEDLNQYIDEEKEDLNQYIDEEKIENPNMESPFRRPSLKKSSTVENFQNVGNNRAHNISLPLQISGQIKQSTLPQATKIFQNMLFSPLANNRRSFRQLSRTQETKFVSMLQALEKLKEKSPEYAHIIDKSLDNISLYCRGATPENVVLHLNKGLVILEHYLDKLEAQEKALDSQTSPEKFRELSHAMASESFPALLMLEGGEDRQEKVIKFNCDLAQIYGQQKGLDENLATNFVRDHSLKYLHILSSQKRITVHQLRTEFLQSIPQEDRTQMLNSVQEYIEKDINNLNASLNKKYWNKFQIENAGAIGVKPKNNAEQLDIYNIEEAINYFNFQERMYLKDTERKGKFKLRHPFSSRRSQTSKKT